MPDGSQDVGVGRHVLVDGAAFGRVWSVWADYYAWVRVYLVPDDLAPDADGCDLDHRAFDLDLGDEQDQATFSGCCGGRLVPDCGSGRVVACAQGEGKGAVGLLLCDDDVGCVESLGTQVCRYLFDV
jgi:hypothetical protein